MLTRLALDKARRSLRAAEAGAAEDPSALLRWQGIVCHLEAAVALVSGGEARR